MLKTKIPLVLALCTYGAQGAEGQIITLSCDGTVEAPVDLGTVEPGSPARDMSFVVHLGTGSSEFDGIELLLQNRAGDVSLKFQRDWRVPDAVYGHVDATLDRITGRLEVIKVLDEKRDGKWKQTNTVWELSCKPAKPLF